MDLTPEFFKSCQSETAKARHLVLPYILGNVIDIGAGGHPVVERAIQIELPEGNHEGGYQWYHSGEEPKGFGRWHSGALNLPFREDVVDTVFSSHLLEDFEDWEPALWEWLRVLKEGGHLIILMPEETRWNAAVAAGQPPNCQHRHLWRGPHDLAQATSHLANLKVIEERLTDLYPGDYGVIFVAKKLNIFQPNA